MSTSVKLTDYFKDKLKKEEEKEGGTTATSGQSITLGAHTLPGTTTTVTDRPTLPTTPGSAPTLSEALQVTTPGVTSGNTINPGLVSGGNNVPNVNASAIDPTKIGTYADAYKYTTGNGGADSGADRGADGYKNAGEGNLGESYEVEGPTVKTEPMSFEEYILSLKSKADDQYKRDILNAQNTYDQSRSAYGTQAAALSGMGLTGSGYSDYLDSRAYGQMQADKNAAARTRQDVYDSADLKMMDYLDTQDTNRRNAYTSLYNDITFNTSESDIDNLGKVLGLSGDDITSLKQTRIDRIKQYLDNPDVTYTINDLNRFFPNGGAEYDAYKAKLADTANDIDWESAKTASAEDLAAVIKGAKESGATEENLKELQDIYDSRFAIVLEVKGGTVKYTGEGALNNFNANSKEDNFKVELVDKNGTSTEYKVEQGGEVTEGDPDADVISAARSVPANQVFYYSGGLYMKYQNKIYRIQGRANAESFNKLLALFTENLENSSSNSSSNNTEEEDW